MTALQILMDRILEVWKVVPRPNQQTVEAQLEFEHPREAEAVSRCDFVQAALLADFSLPEAMMASLSRECRLYFAGSFMMLLVDAISRMRGNAPMLKEVTGSADMVASIAAFELMVVLETRGGADVLEIASPDALQLMFDCAILIDASSHVVMLTDKQHESVGFGAREILRRLK